MAKVIETPLKLHTKTSVRLKRVRTTGGGFTVLHTINADSPTFAADLSYVFRKNVTKARRTLKS